MKVWHMQIHIWFSLLNILYLLLRVCSQHKSDENRRRKRRLSARTKLCFPRFGRVSLFSFHIFLFSYNVEMKKKKAVGLPLWVQKPRFYFIHFVLCKSNLSQAAPISSTIAKKVSKGRLHILAEAELVDHISRWRQVEFWLVLFDTWCSAANVPTI